MSVTVAETAAFLRAREAARQAALALQREHSQSLLPKAADRLREHGATRVVAFGSLIWGTTHEQSDVDLAVEGVSADAYWAALGDLEDLFDCDVDLVRLETAHSGLCERIFRDGLVL